MNINLRRQRSLKVLLVCLGILAVSSGWMLPVLAAGEVVQAEVLPASLQVPRQGAASALLVLRNPTADELDIVGFSYFPEDNVDITFDSNGTVVPAGEMAFWNLHVERKQLAFFKQTVYVIIKYERKPLGAGQTIQAAEIATLEVTATGASLTGKPIDASTRMAEGTIVENLPGVVYLILQNTSGENLSVDPPGVKADDALEITTAASFPLLLAPFDQVAIPYTVALKKNSSLQPGKTTVAFAITAQTLESGQKIQAAASQDVTTGVLGGSDILGLLGVPSLLVLSGFLMVTTFLTLGKLMTGGDPRIGIKDPGFWLIAISLSMVTALLYPPLTRLLVWMGILQQPRNYLTGYGLVDIVVIWVFSIVISALVFGTFTLLRSWWSAYRTPGANDLQLTLLRKLYQQGLGVVCQRVKITTKSSETITGFLLEPKSEEPKEVWIGPGIALSWQAGSDLNLLKSRIKELLNTNTARDLKALLKLLKKGAGESILTLDWKVEDPRLRNIRNVSVEKYEELGVPQIIVRPGL